MNIYLTVIATLIAAIVAWTGYQQHKLAKEKLKLDLFEKRFEVYKGVQQFLTAIMTEGCFSLKNLFEFRGKTQDSAFLFGKDIPKYIRSIDTKSLKLRSTSGQYKGLPVGERRTQLCELESELLKKLTDELTNLQDVFMPYLGFQKWK